MRSLRPLRRDVHGGTECFRGGHHRVNESNIAFFATPGDGLLPQQMLALLAITLPRRCVTMSASKVLDRSKIREEIRVGTLVVPAKRTGEFLGKLRPHLLNCLLYTSPSPRD